MLKNIEELGRRQLYGVSAPTGGTYLQGDIVWNITPSPGNYAGWICVQGGTFGTKVEPVFKGFGKIEY